MAAVTIATTDRPRDASGRFAPRASDREEQLEQALGEAAGIVYDLQERLHGVDQQLDEKGWHQLFQHDLLDGGLTLDQIQFASEQLRETVAANPVLKRGSQARLTYVWGGGVAFGAVLSNGKPSKLTAEVLDRTKAPGANWRYVFSNTAHEELERAAFTDGNLFFLGDDSAYTFSRVSMREIRADMRNPDNAEEIWMFRREWDRNPLGRTATEKDHQVRWYYTDLFTGTRRSYVKPNADGPLEAVDKGKTIVHIAFNQQTGWAYGIPDALPVIGWLKLYREFLKNGYVMSKALAQIAFKVTSQSVAGASRAAAEVVLPGQGGSAATMGNGNDLSAVSTAGRGYDFASGKPLAAAIAAGLEISVETLLAGQITETLDITARLMATMRRLAWDDAFARIFARLGSTRALRTTWSDLPVEQIQRQMQAWTLLRNSGAFEGEVVQAGMAHTMNIADPGALPADYQTQVSSGSTTGATATDGTGQGDGDGNPTGNNDTR
jgi:hypothetical protein